MTTNKNNQKGFESALSIVKVQTSKIRAVRGFSLLELIISVALLMFVGAVGFFAIRNQLLGTLDAEAEVIASRIGEGQSRAIAGVSSTPWGIRFDNTTSTGPRYMLFQGSSYITSSITYFLTNSVEFQTPASGTTTDIAFEKFSGTIATSTSITIRLKTSLTDAKTITVTAQGVISAQ